MQIIGLNFKIVEINALSFSKVIDEEIVLSKREIILRMRK